MNKIWKVIRDNKKISIIVTVFSLITGSIGIYEFCTKPKFEGKLKTFYGDTKIIFGNSTIEGVPNILVVNDNPIFTATVKNDKLYISIIIFDRDGKIVAYIEENKWKINKNNYFKMDISASEVKVINQYGEVALHCIALRDGAVKVNGVFYVDGFQIIATDEGLLFNTIE